MSADTPVLDREAQRWSPGARLALVALVIGMGVSLWTLVHPWYDPMNDGSMYIATARSILAGDGYSFLGQPFHVRPPGMAVILAPVLSIFGTDFFALNLTVALLGLAGLALLFVLMRPSSGWPLTLAVVVCLWLNPSFRSFSNQVMSDVPGTSFLILGLVVERWASRKRSFARELVLGLSIAAGAYVRTVVVLLVPAILISRAWRRASGRLDSDEGWGAFAGRRLAVFVAVVLLAHLPWSLRQSSIEPTRPADQTFVYSYSTGMFHEDVGDPDSRKLAVGEILERGRRRTGQIAGTFTNRMATLDASTTRCLLALLFVLPLGIRSWRRREPTEICVFGTLAVLVFYFGYQERLLLPVYVLSFAVAAEVWRDLIARWVAPGVASGVLVTLVLGLTALDLDLKPDWGVIRKRHRDFVALAEEAQGVLGDERLAAGSAFHYQVYLERPVWSLYFSAKRADDPAACEATIDRYGITHVLLWERFKQDRQIQGYLMKRYPTVRRIGPAALVEVR